MRPGERLHLRRVRGVDARDRVARAVTDRIRHAAGPIEVVVGEHHLLQPWTPGAQPRDRLAHRADADQQDLHDLVDPGCMPACGRSPRPWRLASPGLSTGRAECLPRDRRGRGLRGSAARPGSASSVTRAQVGQYQRASTGRAAGGVAQRLAPVGPGGAPRGEQPQHPGQLQPLLAEAVGEAQRPPRIRLPDHDPAALQAPQAVGEDVGRDPGTAAWSSPNRRGPSSSASTSSSDQRSPRAPARRRAARPAADAVAGVGGSDRGRGHRVIVARLRACAVSRSVVTCKSQVTSHRRRRRRDPMEQPNRCPRSSPSSPTLRAPSRTRVGPVRRPRRGRLATRQRHRRR